MSLVRLGKATQAAAGEDEALFSSYALAFLEDGAAALLGVLSGSC